MAINTFRERLILILLLFGLLVVVARAFYVQILMADFLAEEGDKRQVRSFEIPAPRGQILDRNNQILALSTPVASVWVDPKVLHTQPQAIEVLARELNVSSAGLTQRVMANKERRFLFLQRAILPQQAAKIEALGLSGVHIKDEYKRYYPQAESTAHLVGYTNIDDKGQDGVEFIYDGWLSGQSGQKLIIKDLEGRVVRFVKDIEQAKPGRSIQLSIDQDIQYFAQRALKNAMVKHQAKSASLVVLDAKTGEVLALVNQPGFNPNNRAQIRGEGIRNRVVSSLLEPGSTIKPLVIAKALELGVIQPYEQINTSPGYVNVQGHMISDATNYGTLDIGQVIQKSSNVAMVNIGRRMQPEQQWNLLHELGFGQDLGLFLPGEVAGHLRHFSEWSRVDHLSSAFGYGLSANLMQLAHAYLVFANDGQLPPLSILKLDTPPQMKPVLSPQAVKQVLAMMETVVQRGGTGTAARIDGYRVAGKTGTVHKAKAGGYQESQYMATFVGLVPASRPELVMAVTIDEPSRGVYGGGAVAAPIFSEVMQHALRLRNIDPDGAM